MEKGETKERAINEIKIRVCDRFPVEEEFDFDDELVVFLKGEIVKREIKNNQDNTVDLVLTLKAGDYEIKRGVDK
jgi:hypothetical protein